LIGEPIGTLSVLASKIMVIRLVYKLQECFWGKKTSKPTLPIFKKMEKRPKTLKVAVNWFASIGRN